nr:hypothetical protein [Tanacetum cinerariifolium]
GFFALGLEAGRHVGVQGGVYLRLYLGPLLLHPQHRVGAGVVAGGQLVPEGAASAEALVPAHVVKPEQVVERAGLGVAPLLLHLRLVERQRIAARGSAVEP